MGQYYAINGSFLLEPALGVQRYAAEILKQMNKMAHIRSACGWCWCCLKHRALRKSAGNFQILKYAVREKAGV